MKKCKTNNEYLKIVSNILENEEFMKLEDIIHHDDNRLDHSLRVSFYSYKITKKLGLDYNSTARAALLHDFFYEVPKELSKKEKKKLLINHSKKALKNSKKHFELNKLEEDIILSHMFPIGTTIPKYFESWIVDVVDDGISIYEELYSGYVRFKTRISN